MSIAKSAMQHFISQCKTANESLSWGKNATFGYLG